MKGIREANIAAADLLDALAAGDRQQYRYALLRMFAFVGTDLSKRRLAEGELDDNEAFLAQTQDDPLYDFLHATLNAEASASQIFQDVFVTWILEQKRDGYFVEVGAGDGRRLSNTWLLEARYGWRGLLVEPNPAYDSTLYDHRRANIDARCVASESGKTVQFECTQVPEFSRIVGSQEDIHSDLESRNVAELVERKTVSLNDLLAEHGAPQDIDYLSIDIEGLELDALEAFDFGRYHVRVATVEHNYRDDQAGLDALFEDNGYARLFPEFARFDGWYVHGDDLPRAFERYDRTGQSVRPEYPRLLPGREEKLADALLTFRSLASTPAWRQPLAKYMHYRALMHQMRDLTGDR